MSLRVARAWLALSALSLAPQTAAAQCARWAPGFDSAGGGATVRALLVHDDGSGPALFVGGDAEIARLEGSTWSAVGGGVVGDVRALAAFDDGNGPALYVAGDITRVGDLSVANIARWDGVSWSVLGTGVDGRVHALEVFDDGSGPALYVAGSFTGAGGAPAARIARWDGTAWSTLGGGLPQAVDALEVFDDGSGPALFAGGIFSAGLGAPGNFVARWDGTSWAPLGSGTDGAVHALAVFDDGSGPALYAGGQFATAGGTSSPALARWDGSAWSPTGLPAFPGATVRELAVDDDGSGPALVAAGRIGGSTTDDGIARFDGSAWTHLGTSTQVVEALASYDAGDGPALIAGGTFSSIDGAQALSIARRQGTTWSAVSYGDGLFGAAALATHDDGGGLALFAAGGIPQAGETVLGVGRFDGTSWSGLGGTFFGAVTELASFDDGSGPALYAGGSFFLDAGGPTIQDVARWDGGSWSAAGAVGGNVRAFEVFDDGGGPALYAATGAGVERWNGSAWSAVANGSGFEGPVHALEVFDDGSGPALYAAGFFPAVDGQPARRIARWNGVSWSSVGSGFSGGTVFALFVHDDGSGPALYAGGGFTTAGGAPASRVARWDGTSWSAIGFPAETTVRAFASFDDGTGPALYVGADFLGVLRWNGASWSTPGVGVDSTVVAFAVFAATSGGAEALYAGGSFRTAGGLPSGSIARWERCPGEPSPFCFGDASAALCPCGNAGAPGHGCANSVEQSGAVLSSTGTTAPDTLVLVSSGETPSALSIFLQGDATLANPAVFGDGLRCVGGNLKRLYVENAVAGTASAPAPGDPSITQRSSTLGDPIAPGSTRYYQAYYRDPDATFCSAPVGDTWNASNGLAVGW